MRERLSTIITNNYKSWLDYAQKIISSSKSTLEPGEVVNDVILRLMEKDSFKLMQLIDQNDGHGLDYYVKRVIKVAIISPRSNLRYQKGGYCTTAVEWIENVNCKENADAEVLNVSDASDLVSTILEDLPISKEDKDIFLWRYFGRSYAEYPIRHTASKFSKTYLRVKRQILPILMKQVVL